MKKGLAILSITLPILIAVSLISQVKIGNANTPGGLEPRPKVKISKRAKEQLQMVAELASCGLKMEFSKEETSGRYHFAYGNFNSLAKDPNLEDLLFILGEVADFDKSGIVDSKEGSDLYQLVEFGQKVQVALLFLGHDVGLISESFGMSENDFLHEAKDYDTFVEEMRLTGIDGFPILQISEERQFGFPFGQVYLSERSRSQLRIESSSPMLLSVLPPHRFKNADGTISVSADTTRYSATHFQVFKKTGLSFVLRAQDGSQVERYNFPLVAPGWYNIQILNKGSIPQGKHRMFMEHKGEQLFLGPYLIGPGQ